jgi:large subunit ribosomal protein L22
MQVEATTRNIRMSAQKMREVVRQIQGLPALKAQAVLEVVPRKGARLVAKTLKAALANAEYLHNGGDANQWSEAQLRQKITELQVQIQNARNHKRRNALTRKLNQYESFLSSPKRMAPESLRVKEAFAQTATTLRRFAPKARGSAGPILKRNCHVKIVLSDE